jgi:hypothetical protein
MRIRIEQGHMDTWTIANAIELYGVRRRGKGYFGGHCQINEPLPRGRLV